MKKKMVIFLASGGGLGFSPKAPGTVGTLLGVGLVLLSPNNIYLILAVIILGIWAAHEAEKWLNEHDSPKIVVDEIAGYLIAAYGWQGGFLFVSFIVFRLLDILKPGPIGQLQGLPGGFGIMADDIAAGLLTNLLMILAVRLLPFWDEIKKNTEDTERKESTEKS